MGQRTEQRIAVSFQVTVRGWDIHGHPFETEVETQDISCSGACLNGAGKFVQPGSKIEIQHKDQKAWYRVQWVDASVGGTGRAGVRCLEPGNYIWGVPPKEWVPDDYDPSNPKIVVPAPVEVPPAYVSASTWSGADRRQFPRQSCRIEAQINTDDDSAGMPGTVTDISLGGCYVEMLAPLPIDTQVELLLKSEGATLEMSGRVRSSQMGLGMGIAFTEMRAENFEKLQRLAPAPTNPVAARGVSGIEAHIQRDAARPEVSRAPREQTRPSAQRAPEAGDVPPTAEAFQAVVRLLFRKRLLTREELMEELEKFKLTRA